jgi:glucosamine kinase
MDFVLGIDGGGTSCRAALAAPDGRVLARASSGAANIRTDLTNARTHIVEAARRAFVEAGQDPELLVHTPAVLGLAGANVGTYRQQLQAILPFRESRVESDAEIALEGAVGSGDGAIAVLGTGSAYRVRRGGVSRPVGRDLLEQTLLAYDGICEASALTREIMAVFRDNPEDLVEFTVGAKPGDYGGFAPKVFEYAAEGDMVARSIVSKAVADVEGALGALDLREGDVLCLLGGLAGLYAPLLAARYQPLLREPRGDALLGAVRMAARRFGTSVEAVNG